ncbi:adenosylcobinamide-GDP ribazoletransferase [Alkalihalobacillus sp. LMS39]|uniref:adenosylcobinamide-GDP ribazoletransferase n=1 Tax=Alkalihalobacillus sp. LMS39 TaxID=2924032 RepID=UPI001FB37572|nr:adenosylcobinamide-GDP ribazoletransferase [Alkalihalobacillus sp. LMS39]UOE96443.1 adenosylcobinamide-GDP ribazoletransferase [Alkalihalobacillus sp. LMS39]
MKKISLFDGFLLALQFLTIFPVKKQVPWDESRARGSIVVYPLVGLFLGLILAFLYYTIETWTGTSVLFLTVFLFTVSIVFTGGLHLDGWMDVSDAIGSHRDIEKKHNILKDSRVGAYAVLSVIFLLGWRLFFMYEVFEATSNGWLYMLSIPFFVKLLMGLQLFYGKPAKQEGLAYSFQCFLTKKHSIVYFLYIVIFGIVLFFVDSHTLIIWLVLFVMTILLTWISLRIATVQFNGITGDTVGASAEGGETLLWMTVWLLHFFVMV